MIDTSFYKWTIDLDNGLHILPVKGMRGSPLDFIMNANEFKKAYCLENYPDITNHLRLMTHFEKIGAPFLRMSELQKWALQLIKKPRNMGIVTLVNAVLEIQEVLERVDNYPEKNLEEALKNA